MSSTTACVTKAVKGPSACVKKSYWPASIDSPATRAKRHSPESDSAAATMGIPKKKYSRNWKEESSTIPPLLVNQASPIYDIDGMDIGLYLDQPSDRLVDTTLSHVFEYIHSKTKTAQAELERVMAMAKTNGPRGTISHMIRVIQIDRNLKLTMHYMLMAEHARLSVAACEPQVLLPLLQGSQPQDSMPYAAKPNL